MYYNIYILIVKKSKMQNTQQKLEQLLLDMQEEMKENGFEVAVEKLEACLKEQNMDRLGTYAMLFALLKT